ncbi:MAG: hypothetical protein ACI8R9_002779 [Paraglaciecola sp.]|jgi:hypothetical protein
MITRHKEEFEFYRNLSSKASQAPGTVMGTLGSIYVNACTISNFLIIEKS